MSAYVLHDEEYIKAAAAIRALAYSPKIIGHDRLREFHGRDYNGIDNAMRLAYALNRKAVALRYRGKWQSANNGVKRGINRRISVTANVQLAFNVLKFLNCALYQMSEGTVYECKGFKHIESLRDIIQNIAIENCEQYNAAPWSLMKITTPEN